jgi:hypothetical protein
VLPPHGHHRHAVVATLPPLRCHRSAATTAALPTPLPRYPLPLRCCQRAATALPLSIKKFVAGHIKNILVAPPTTTAPHNKFIMSDEEGEYCRRAAASHCRADDTLPLLHCRWCQCCTAAKLPPLPPSLTLYVSLLLSFPSPLLLLLLVDCWLLVVPPP